MELLSKISKYSYKIMETPLICKYEVNNIKCLVVNSWLFRELGKEISSASNYVWKHLVRTLKNVEFGT